MRGLRLITLLALVIFCVVNLETCRQVFRVFENVYDKHLQRQEIKKIVEAIEHDYMITKTIPASDFHSYLRSNMQQARLKKTRDPAKDFWRTPFLLRVREKGIEIISAGPDQRFSSSDDIKVYRELEEFNGAVYSNNSDMMPAEPRKTTTSKQRGVRKKTGAARYFQRLMKKIGW